MDQESGNKFSDKTSKKLNRMSTRDLAELMSIAQELKNAMQGQDTKKLEALESSKHLLLVLLEYLIQNMDNPNVDAELVAMLQKFLGINMDKEKQLSEEEEEEREYTEMSKEQKEHLHRMMVYEIYKVLNPNRIAGETPIENFINNVQRYGLKEAMQQEGKEFAKHFKIGDLERLGSHKHSFVDNLEKQGIKHTKGWGRGV